LRGWLQEHAEESGSLTTLENLSVFLTLDKARTTCNFKQEEYGLNDEEAFNIARMFTKCDLQLRVACFIDPRAAKQCTSKL
jgi:hypothetical protein